MIKNYLIITFRSLKYNLSYAFLNVFGLALGSAACIVIFLVVKNELSFDNYDKADRIYRVTLNALDYNANVSMAIAPAMRTDFPELEQVSQVLYKDEAVVKVNNSRFLEKQCAVVDEHFTKIFNCKWLAGDPASALSEPNAVVLTESVAHKYFGNKNAIGQTINFDNELTAKVTGIIKDGPENTSLPFRFLISFESIKNSMKGNMSNFYAIGGGFFTYILLPQNVKISQIQRRIPAFLQKNWTKEVGKEVKLPMQPLKNIHFDQRYINNIVTPTSKNTYYALYGVALLIMLTACINFINLATAQAIRRSKEVGVRKVLGASRFQMIKQFMGETTVLVISALLLGIIIASLFLSHSATWLNINVDTGRLYQPSMLLWISILTLAVILFAGLYPAFVLSSYLPVNSLKQKDTSVVKGFTLRKSLVVSQFVISQVLIIGTLIVAHQMDFFQNQELGFNKDAILSVSVPDKSKIEIFKQQLLNNPGVKQVSFSSGAPSYNSNFAPFSSAELGMTKDDVTEIKDIDGNYIDMFGLTMLAGNKITNINAKDTVRNIVVNETMIHKLGIQNPNKAIGKHLNLGGVSATIIGVIKDFQSESKQKKIRPCALEYRAENFFVAAVQLQHNGFNQTLDRMDKSWSALFPDNLFVYEFLDAHIASFYIQEQKVYTAFKLFAFIAIFIGCLGLYGLVSFSASQRTKEIGIRKLLGASLMNIIGLFSKEFILLLAIAFVIAVPVAYFSMYNWLQNYAYHISIGPSIFLISLAVSFCIAAITVIYQTVKAALANPVKCLRSE